MKRSTALIIAAISCTAPAASAATTQPIAKLMQVLSTQPALPGGCIWRKVDFRAAVREIPAVGYAEIAWGGMGETLNIQPTGTYTESALGGGILSRRYDTVGVVGSGWGEQNARKVLEVRTDARGKVTYFEITFSSYKKGFLGLGGGWKPYKTKVCQ